MDSHLALVVDDNEENLYFLKTLLQGHGYEVITAVQGAEALDKAGKKRPNLIISDILMPVMDGFVFCRECKNNDSLKNIPFIFYTATYTDPQDELLAHKLGADDFIVKPCEPEILMEAVRRAGNNAGDKEAPPEQESLKDDGILKLYNKRLIFKLEQKMLQLEQEIASRKTVETSLRESEEKHRRMFETMPHGIVYQNPDGAIIYANPAAENILGISFDQMRERTSLDSRWNSIHEDGSIFPGEAHPAMIAFRTGKPVIDVVMGIYNPNLAARRWIKISAIPLFQSDEQKPYQVYTIFDDITGYKELQAQFLQAQKMEAIGKLAGGVAHDFNNHLTVIKGYANMIQESLPVDDPLREDAKEVLLAAKHAANLTSQLLAFSRKQLIQPARLNLNAIIREVGKMLDRLLGEKIQLELRLQSDLGLILADAGQMQQILLNLVVNARDAMPEGGRLEIATTHVALDEIFVARFPFIRPGFYVMLAVNDTGIGMDSNVQSQIFEPFFTTKKPGLGTGLGLSTVYGIVKQSNGFILVDSESGKGASFRIYFPIAEGEAAPLIMKEKPETFPGGGETVLLAEDEASVRTLITRILREHGYKVLEASSGEEALEIAEKHKGIIDMVLTDSVMPGINGKEMVSRLEIRRPGIRVLYISGYTNTGIVHKDILEPGIAFLSKPFTAETLLQKVHSVLNA